MSVPQGIITQELSSAAAGYLTGASGTSAGRAQFSSTFEKNPVILFGGIAGSSYRNSLLISAIAGGLPLEFVPMAGGSLLSAQAAQYPFANQGIAANALIQQPLRISMLCRMPASTDGVGYLSKAAAVTALIRSLTLHNNLGGLYSVVTPAYTYTNCMLLDVIDASDGTARQSQFQYRFDFYQPLITLQQAQEAQSSLMAAMSAGTPIIGQPAWSGPQNGNPAGFATNSNTGLIAPSAVQ